MDPRVYRQWSPPVRKGSRAFPGLGLFVNVDPDTAEKAVPIIGEDKESAPAPKLILPGVAPKPAAKILSPGGTAQQPSGKLVTPGAKPRTEAGLVDPGGSPVAAPKPEVFQGKAPRPTPQAPSASKLGGGLVAPGPQPNPGAKLILPGESAPKTTGSLARTPYDKPMQPDRKLVDPQGRPASSRLTEGPGAAKPSPKLVVPGAEAPKTSGSLVVPSGVTGGRGGQQTAGAEAMQQAGQAKQQAQRKLAEQTEQRFIDEGPSGPTKPSAGATSNAPKEGKKTSTGGAQISGPNIVGGLAHGAMYSNLAAPLSAVAMDVGGGLQGVTSTGTRHERDRDTRTGIAQRHEMVRQGDMQARAARSTQSAMNRSQTAREDTVQVRPGLRLYVNG